MKKNLKLILTLAAVTPVLAFGGVALAVEGTNSTDTTTTESTESTNKTALQERIEKRKTALKTKLTTLQQDRLKLKCKTGQVKVKVLSNRIKGLETSRNQVYNNLTSRLTNLSTKLRAQDVDTTTLDAQITELKTKIETFKTDLASYKQDVADLGDVDCVTDPTGFQAALEASRANREKLVKDALAIKTYVTDTIKPTLVALHNQLETKDETSEGSQ